MLTAEAIEALALKARATIGSADTSRRAHVDRLHWRAHTFEGVWGMVEVRFHECQALDDHEYAFTLVDHDEPLAWIGMNPDAWRELALAVPRTAFSAAHELSHALIHGPILRDGIDPSANGQLEEEANLFAAHFLLPDAALRHLKPGFDPAEVCERYTVSPDTLRKRLAEWSRRSLL